MFYFVNRQEWGGGGETLFYDKFSQSWQAWQSDIHRLCLNGGGEKNLFVYTFVGKSGSAPKWAFHALFIQPWRVFQLTNFYAAGNKRAESTAIFLPLFPVSCHDIFFSQKLGDMESTSQKRR